MSVSRFYPVAVINAGKAAMQSAGESAKTEFLYASRLILRCSPLDVEIIPDQVIFPFVQVVRRQWFSEIYQENLRSFLISSMKGETGAFFGFFRG